MRKTVAIFITVWAVWLVAIVVGVFANSILHVALHPWYMFCEFITPLDWLIGGNMFMASLWSATGVTAYGLLLSIIPVTLVQNRQTRSS
jgi:hypothetical protein